MNVIAIGCIYSKKKGNLTKCSPNKMKSRIWATSNYSSFRKFNIVLHFVTSSSLIRTRGKVEIEILGLTSKRVPEVTLPIAVLLFVKRQIE